MQKALQSLHVIGELMFNDGGGYETDVDHLRDTFNGLYRQEMPFWMSKLKNFTNLVQLDLANPTPIPLTEASGEYIERRSDHLLMSSPDRWRHQAPSQGAQKAQSVCLEELDQCKFHNQNNQI